MATRYAHHLAGYAMRRHADPIKWDNSGNWFSCGITWSCRVRGEACSVLGPAACCCCHPAGGPGRPRKGPPEEQTHAGVLIKQGRQPDRLCFALPWSLVTAFHLIPASYPAASSTLSSWFQFLIHLLLAASSSLHPEKWFLFGTQYIS